MRFRQRVVQVAPTTEICVVRADLVTDCTRLLDLIVDADEVDKRLWILAE